MNRRSLFKRLGVAAAVVAIAPAVSVQAEPACAECEQIRANPTPVPDAFKVPKEWTDAAIEVTHTVALRDGISHQAATIQLYPRYFLEPPNDIIYASHANTPARLAIGTKRDHLVSLHDA